MCARSGRVSETPPKEIIRAHAGAHSRTPSSARRTGTSGRAERSGRCSEESGSWKLLVGVDCQTIRLPLHGCIRWRHIW